MGIVTDALWLLHVPRKQWFCSLCFISARLFLCRPPCLNRLS